MKNKKKLIQFIIISLVFCIAAWWIYHTLSTNFADYVEERNFNEIELFARTGPEEDEFTSELGASWLKTVGESIPGAEALYFEYNDAIFNYEPTFGSPVAKSLYSQYKNTQAYKTALDGLYYLEPTTLSSLYSAPFGLNETSTIEDATKSRVYFVPIVDSNGYEASGAVMIVVPNSATSGYASLLRTLMLGLAIVFIVVAFILMLTRDPMTGFMVLGLFVIVAIFVAYPLLEAVRLSFLVNGRFSLDNWKENLNPAYLKALWGSIKLGVVTATLSTCVGFLFAFLVERTSSKHKKLMGTLATMPVISPPFSLSLSIILLFGNNGLITKQLLGMSTTIYGLGGLSIVQTIGMFPIAFMTISSVLKQIDSTVEDASLDLSATRWQTFKSITLPLALPGIISAWLLVFTNSLADFANPMLLQGDYKVLSVEAYLIVVGRNKLGGGAVLSFLLLLPTLTAFMAQRYWVSKKSFVTVTGKPSSTLTELTNKPVRVTLTTIAWFILGFIVCLYLTIFAGCFVQNWGIDYTFTLSHWGEAIQSGWNSIRDTVTLAAIATPIAGLLAMMGAMLIVRKKFPGKRLLESLIMTPYAIPGTLIGIAYILAFNKPPILLVGTGAIIVINYIIRELPVGLENGINALRQIDPAIEEAASDLGADVSTVFRTIVLPLVRPAFISSMSYTFVRSMTAVSAIIFLISARWNHLTVLIYSYSENIRFGLASVLSTILIAIVLTVFFLMNVLVKDDKLTTKTISPR